MNMQAVCIDVGVAGMEAAAREPGSNNSEGGSNRGIWSIGRCGA